MKVNAYIMAADPAWIEASVRSYYDLVDRIVVSYDEDGLGWTGLPLDIEQCLRRLRAIDHAGKCDYQAGHYARPAYFARPLENDTYQRQCALDQAGPGADWVLQLDTDEIIGQLGTFTECLQQAHLQRSAAFNYPGLWLYSRAFGSWCLEWGGRGWRRSPGYPGPLAVRPGSQLTLARRVAGRHFHVDLTWRGSPGRVPNGIPVDRVIAPADAVWHLSMWRDEGWLRRKFASSGHSRERDWHPEIQGWVWAQKHPLLKAALSQFSRGPYKRPLRLSRLPAPVQRLIAESCVSDRPEPVGTPLVLP